MEAGTGKLVFPANVTTCVCVCVGQHFCGLFLFSCRFLGKAKDKSYRIGTWVWAKMLRN